MPFIGKNPTSGFSTIVKDDLTADGSTTAFTLSKQVASANDVAVFVGNVRQEPTDAYSVSGTTLTMTAAPASGINFYVLHIAGTLESSVIPADDTISTTKIQNDAVTSAKMDTNIALDGTLTLNGVTPQTTYAIQTQTKSVYLSSTDTTYSNLTVKKGSATTTDYLQLRDESNNLDFKIDSVGRMNITNQPRFFAYNSGRFPSSGNIGGNEIFVFNNTNINVGNHFDTSNYRFTAPIAGTYVFGCHMRVANDGSTRVMRIMLRKNGAQQWDLASIGGSETPALSGHDHPGLAGVTMISANASDYFDLQISSELNYNGGFYFDSGTRTNFWGYLLA